MHEPERFLELTVDSHDHAKRDGPAKAGGITTGGTAAARMIAARENDGSEPPEFHLPSSSILTGCTPNCESMRKRMRGAALLPRGGAMRPEYNGDVLVRRARDALQQLGCAEQPRDEAYGFAWDEDLT